MRATLLTWVSVAGCAASPHDFPLLDPMTVDTDTHPVSVACRAGSDGPRCAPAEYTSPFIWDQLDNLLFARVSRGLAMDFHGEALNANSLDEVADSSWFTNRDPNNVEDRTLGACKPEDLLPGPDDVKDGEWVIDHGKDNGSTPGFRVDIPGKGKYMLKADDEGKPERASAASVIGAAIYNTLGFYTTCEQVVLVRKSMLKMTPGLKVTDNEGISHPFDDKALDKVLASTTQMHDGLVRLQASKWLPGLALGPFRYVGTRRDDPNDVIDHSDRRELRGSRLLAAWLDHWDAREQNSMDVWFAVDEKHKKSSPGFVRHYILDTSDTLGGEVGEDQMSRRLGHGYEFDLADILRAIVTLGAEERPWDRAHHRKGEEKFGYYTARDFDPSAWHPFYPNPAFLRMTERDGAWMARKIARLSPDDIRKFVELGRWSRPIDAIYLTNVLLERQRLLLVRYLSKLSPLGDVRIADGSVCAVDFARLRQIVPETSFRYTIVEHSRGRAVGVPADVRGDGEVCWRPIPVPTDAATDDDPARRVTFVVRNGTRAGALQVYVYDLGPRGWKLVGLTRDPG